MSDVAAGQPGPQRLQRQVIKWLQGLDLAYSIKSVRRDFSNGFLVAEIFSRYFPNEVQMHSFETGSSLAKRGDNWRQLVLFFRKIGFNIRREEETINGVVACEMVGGKLAVISLLNQMYTFLTARKVNVSSAPKLIPSMRARQRKSERLAGVPESPSASLRGGSSQAESRVEDQEVSRSNLLSAAEGEGTSSSSELRKASKLLRGKVRTMSHGTGNRAQVKAGTINVRSLDVDVMKLRAQRHGTSLADQGSLLGESRYSDLSGEGKDADYLNDHSGSMAGSSLNLNGVDNPLSIVGAAVVEVLGPKAGFTPQTFLAELQGIGNEKECAIREIELLEILRLVLKSADTLAACSLTFPQEWAIVAPALVNVFVELRLVQAGSVLARVGSWLAQYNQLLAASSFTDFILPGLEPLLKGSDYVDRAGAVTIFLAHCPLSGVRHPRNFRRLVTHIKSLKSSILCVVAMLNLSRDLVLMWPSKLTQAFVDIATKGLLNTSPVVRSASLAIIKRVLCDLTRTCAAQSDTLGQKQGRDEGESESKSDQGSEAKSDAEGARPVPNFDIADSLLEQVSTLLCDDWWETQAQLGMLGATLLDPNHLISDNSAAIAMSLITGVLEKRNASVATKVLLCANMGPLIESRPEVMHVFCKVFFSLEDEKLRCQLLDSETIDVQVRLCALEGTDLPRSLFSSLKSALVLEWIGDGNLELGKHLTAPQLDLLSSLLAWNGQRQDPGTDISRALLERVFATISTPLIRTLETSKRSPRSFELVLQLLFDRFCKNGINIFLHPQWAETLLRVFGAGEEGEALRESQAPALAKRLDGASKFEGSVDENLTATARALLEDTAEKYPTMRNLALFRQFTKKK